MGGTMKWENDLYRQEEWDVWMKISILKGVVRTI